MQKRPFFKTFFGSLLLIIAICFVMYFVFFASLSWITGHGKELTVPDLKGKTLQETVAELEKSGFQIVVDSTYEPEFKPLIVLDQQPIPGFTVKPGRSIFIIVNKIAPPTSPMPNLINLSLRSAELVIKSNRLIFGDTIVKPDMARGAVLDQLFNGGPIAPGTLIAQGSKIDLVIGGGLANVRVNIPDVTNISFEMAVSILSASNLNYEVLYEGDITDTNKAYVLKQLPEAFDESQQPLTAEQGETIRLTIKQHLD